jgi:anti-sigma factor RsiW
MVCESWKENLDTYLDGELPEAETRSFDAHVRVCRSCSADALTRVQMKRTIQVAGRRFTPSAEFRRRVQQRIAPKPQRSLGLGWMFAAAAAVILVVGAVTSTYVGTRSNRGQVFSEIADLHVAIRKHHISVFVFQEQSLRGRLEENSVSPKQLPFNTETWSQGGLRYFVIGDANAADIDSLAKLFKAAS